MTLSFGIEDKGILPDRMVSPGLVVFDLRKFPRDDPARFRGTVLDGKGTAMR